MDAGYFWRERAETRISKASVVSILDGDDCRFLLEEWLELRELEIRELDVLHQMVISFQDLGLYQTGEISVECDVSLTSGVDEGVYLFVEQHRTLEDALPAVEDDCIQVTEILVGVEVVHIDSHPEVDAMFFVENGEEGG